MYLQLIFYYAKFYKNDDCHNLYCFFTITVHNVFYVQNQVKLSTVKAQRIKINLK